MLREYWDCSSRIWIHIPFKTGDQRGIVPLGGHVGVAAEIRGTFIPRIREGKLRLILVLNQNRWEIAPDVSHIGPELVTPTMSIRAMDHEKCHPLGNGHAECLRRKTGFLVPQE